MKTRLIKQSKSEPWKPKPYQKKGVKYILDRAVGGLLLDPGLGKTSITLSAIKTLKANNMISKVLLIAPLRVGPSVWPGEISKWKDFNGITYRILHGKNKDALLEEDADIFIINPEGLKWLLDVQTTTSASGRKKVIVDAKRFKKFGFDTLVVDELSKFKDIRTARFKALKAVLHTFNRRWGLTGSPAPNGLEDLFGQVYVLDQGATFGQYITNFRRQYFEPHYNGFSWSIKEGAQEKIYKKVEHLFLRMSAEDYLKLPKLIENDIYVELPDKVKSVYSKLEDEFIAKIDNGTIVASTAAVASIKLRQIASGAIYNESRMD
jgi:SNF2 family DNA or RNA helicase